jgi:hypothetical protein
LAVDAGEGLGGFVGFGDFGCLAEWSTPLLAAIGLQVSAARETAPPWLSFGPPTASLRAIAETQAPWAP